jgi:hypothetical protein
MGGKSSKPVLYEDPQVRRDRQEESRLNDRNRWLNDQNNEMRRRISHYGSNIWSKTLEILNKQRQLSSDTNKNNNIITGLHGTISGRKSANDVLTGKNIPDQKKVVSSDETALSVANSNINNKKFSYLKDRLRLIHVKTQIFESVSSQNNVIVTKMSNFNETNSGDEQNLQHKRIQMNELKTVNLVLFVFYYLLFFYFCYLLLYMKTLSTYSKIFLFLLFLVYPFYIYDIQYFTYYLARSTYLYLFSIYNIEKVE